MKVCGGLTRREFVRLAGGVAAFATMGSQVFGGAGDKPNIIYSVHENIDDPAKPRTVFRKISADYNKNQRYEKLYYDIVDSDGTKNASDGMIDRYIHITNEKLEKTPRQLGL